MRSRREGAEILQIISRVRCNVLISGGTGSGKTTPELPDTIHRSETDERVITCEDAAELQLQQPHVVRLETRPPNIEGEGQSRCAKLVRQLLRMRPSASSSAKSADPRRSTCCRP